MNFVPLHLHSGYSYLQSGLDAAKIPHLAKKLGYQAVGICDNALLSGYAPFCHAALKEGVKAIYGMDYPLPNGLYSLFALDEDGYSNLLYLAKNASEGNLHLTLLKSHQKGLAKIYAPNDWKEFLRAIKEDPQKAGYSLYQNIKELDVLSLALPFGLSLEDREALRAFARSHSHRLIAFPLISYEKRGDAIVLDIVKAIAEKGYLELDKKDGDEYFLPPDVVSAYYTEEEMRETARLADNASFVFLKKRGGLLRFPCPLGQKSEDYLAELVRKGLKKIGKESDPAYLARAEHELSVIDSMGYADYFLIVSDYVRHAKETGILVGPGRGSGAGSLVSYLLGIVGADPLEYGLLFERFLSPERQSMPDIDVDFEDTRRDEVIHYLQEKYGKERTGHVLTSQIIGAKESLRDIGRVYRYKQSEIELMSDSIMDERRSLRDNYRISKRFRELIDSDPYFLRYVALAAKIEGLPRQAGLHAAGIVLNDRPLDEVAPVTVSPEVGYVCCLEKDYLEEQGFLKMDILGLTNLSTVRRCLDLIEKDKGIKLDFDSLPHEDEKAIELIRNGQTMGLFQLESAGMKRAIKEVGPTSFRDVAALLALFRPGPMDSIPSYALRKAGREKVTYLSPELEPILKETYGIIVYQEQIMQICRASAGMSYGQADLFRRAISKKNAAKLASLKASFIDGCKKNGHSEPLSEALYSLIDRFANYGFNKSHAVTYAVLTCRMAYLKAHYPEEFYPAILDAMGPGSAKFSDTLSEAKRRGLRLALPDINLSDAGFVSQGGFLRFPFGSIKGLPTAFVRALLDERVEHGPFADLSDFAVRLKKAGLNMQNFVRLIDAGAFDGFNASRATLRAGAYGALRYAEMIVGPDGESILLSLHIEKPELTPMPDDEKENLEAEYQALGIMISASPISFHEEEAKARGAIPLSDIASASGPFLTYGIVKSARAITTKKGTKMAFLELYDAFGEASFVLFDEAYGDAYPLLKEGNLLYVAARADRKKEGTYVVTKAEPMGGSEHE